MKCPKCNSLNTYVKDSRPKDDETMINRRHECRDCGYRFNTCQIYKETYDEMHDDFIKDTGKVRKLLNAVFEVMQ